MAVGGSPVGRADRIVALGALLAGLAVVLGAFGAHGLRARVRPELLAVYETGVRYHFYHALGLIALGVFGRARAASSGALPRGSLCVAGCFVAGIALFSGSLYALVLSGIGALGAITPFGGGAFIVGWALFARAALDARSPGA
jgi:uncharacterized membrane protein YgdD (TMEM256/DUF423 family)